MFKFNIVKLLMYIINFIFLKIKKFNKVKEKYILYHLLNYLKYLIA